MLGMRVQTRLKLFAKCLFYETGIVSENDKIKLRII